MTSSWALGVTINPHTAGSGLVSQTRPTSTPKGRVWWTVVQSHCSILSHNALHHCLSTNSSLENGKRELGHLSATTGAVKTLWLYFSGSVLTLQHIIQECIIRNLVTSSANCIPVGHSLYMQFTRPSHPLPFFAEVGLACETSSGLSS